MRIAILAGAVALAAPVVADAAIYDFRFTVDNGRVPAVNIDDYFYEESGFSYYFRFDTNENQSFSYSGDEREFLDFNSTPRVEYFQLNGNTDAEGNVTSASLRAYEESGFGNDLRITVGLDTISVIDEMDYRFEGTGEWNLELVAVPIPASAPMLLAGMGLLGFVRRRS